MGGDSSGGAELVASRRLDILEQVLGEVPRTAAASGVSMLRIALRRRHRFILRKLLHQLLTTCPPSTRKEVLMHQEGLSASSGHNGGGGKDT
jgi:hypothetical protein